MNTKELPDSHFIPLDEEEREIMEAMENGEFSRDILSEDRMKELKIAAKNTIKRIKNRFISKISS